MPYNDANAFATGGHWHTRYKGNTVLVTERYAEPTAVISKQLLTACRCCTRCTLNNSDLWAAACSISLLILTHSYHTS
jgi:hypothetical protein